MIYAEVAVAAPLYQTLTYLVPDGLNRQLLPGMRLLVPLAGRAVTGYLLALSSTPPEHNFRLREIIDALDGEPLFPAAMIPFYRWIADYYHYPVGEVIRAALPAGLTIRSTRSVELTAEGRLALQQFDRDQVSKWSWFDDFVAAGKMSAGQTAKLWRTAARRQLVSWQKKGWVAIHQDLSRQGVKEKKEVCFLLNNTDPDSFSSSLKKSESKALAIIGQLAEKQNTAVPRREIVREYKGAAPALKSLVEKKIITKFERPVFRDPFGETPLHFGTVEKLTTEQEQALADINRAISKGTFAPFLLHGVTGSGKTEVYLRAAAAALARNRKVLVLVPEIALATQLEGHFYSRFGDATAVLHSSLSAGERFDQWLRIVRGERSIVIGARSAIFAPLDDIGLIIVDEEHDSAYKQEDGLLYQARDMAVFRASRQNSVVILGTATPSVASFYHAGKGKYQLLQLTKRVESRQMPEVEIIDLKKVKTVSGKPPILTNPLIRALKENATAGNQSLVFLNRRGFASLMLCQDCGQPVQCRHCHVSLTLHKHKEELTCHYCGYSVKSATICSNCRSARVVAVGFGTERIEEELTKLLPKATIARLDRDTVESRKDYLRVLKGVHDRSIDILIGTQMITKGHHFPGVTLVGIVWGDAGLGMPDYKSGERTFQLLSQVTGRAGRGDRPGKVIVQTFQPEHYSIITARDHNYADLFEQEIGLRSTLGYPPFSRLINLRFEGETEGEVRDCAARLARYGQNLIRKWRSVELLGPAPAPLSRLRGLYRWQLLLKGANIDALHGVCRLLQEKMGTLHSSRVKMAVDVDPENML